jgi:hypothetical protein
MEWRERLNMFGESEDPKVEAVMPCRLKAPRKIIKYPNITGTHANASLSRGFE